MIARWYEKKYIDVEWSRLYISQAASHKKRFRFCSQFETKSIHFAALLTLRLRCSAYHLLWEAIVFFSICTKLSWVRYISSPFERGHLQSDIEIICGFFYLNEYVILLDAWNIHISNSKLLANWHEFTLWNDYIGTQTRRISQLFSIPSIEKLCYCYWSTARSLNAQNLTGSKLCKPCTRWNNTEIFTAGSDFNNFIRSASKSRSEWLPASR